MPGFHIHAIDCVQAAHTAKTWLMYMEWDELRTKAGEKNYKKIEEMAEAVRASAAAGLNASPPAITCAEISLTTLVQLMDSFQNARAGPEAADFFKAKLARCDASEMLQLSACIWRACRWTPHSSCCAAGIANLLDATFDKRLDGLKMEIENDAAACREDLAHRAGLRATNPRLVQQHLLQSAIQSGEPQPEAAAQVQRTRRGRGGRGRSGAVEESRLEMSRTKIENHRKAEKQKKIQRGEEVKQFLQQHLPQDKEERVSRLLDLLSLDLKDLKARVSRCKDQVNS
eukprot:scaffold67802_cov46-Prasinocladus_malaysianus.AAC.2